MREGRKFRTWEQAQPYRFSFFLSHAVLSTVLHACPKLEWLDLTNCTHFGWSVECGVLPQMRALFLLGADVSLPKLKAIVRSCPNLNTIDLGGKGRSARRRREASGRGRGEKGEGGRKG